MASDAQKFLDLDHVCDNIRNPEDRAMFKEAIQCYQIGSHRAAVILAWSVTADCLYRRIESMAADGDGMAQQAKTEVDQEQGKASFEGKLISQAKKCELFDDYEEKCLTFARDTRSKCAHPTGVVPSAEAVRHVLFICSQTVLCREGYRGMNFIKEFVQSKLEDQFLFSDKTRINETCRYYYKKVSERLFPQFAACISSHLSTASSSHWRTNAIIYLKELLAQCERDSAQKITDKLQSVGTKDLHLQAVLVGLDQRPSLWDDTLQAQAKIRLRDKLQRGRIEDFDFYAYANLCALTDFEEPDKNLFIQRFSVLAEKIAQHELLQKNRDEELIKLALEALEDDANKDSVLNGLAELTTTQLFNAETTNIQKFVDLLIQENWMNDGVQNIFQKAVDWTPSLKICFLKNTEKYLLECSEDNPDDIVLVFEIAGNILTELPLQLPSEFESQLKQIIDVAPTWFAEQASAYSTFKGQIELLQTRFASHLPGLADILLPDPIVEDDDLLEEYQ